MSPGLVDVSFNAADRPGRDQQADFGAALADRTLSWHQHTDHDAMVAAITADAATLLAADAAAVITTSTAHKLQIQAAHGLVEMMHTVLPRFEPPPTWAAAAEPPEGPSANPQPRTATLDHRAGTGSMICAPLGIARATFGTLLLLSITGPAFTQESTTKATTLAIHASLALNAAHHHRDLHEAVASRDVIGQAKGILMHRRHITADQAFQLLLSTSQHSNIKLRQVAETLCRTGELVHPQQ